MDLLYKVSWTAGEKLLHASTPEEAREIAVEYLRQPGKLTVEVAEAGAWVEREESQCLSRRVLQPNALEFYQKPSLLPDFYRHVPPPPGGYPPRDTPEAMLKALNGAHDRIEKLVRVNDVLRRDFAETIGILKGERKWRKWMLRTLVPTLLGIIVKLALR